MSHGEKAPCRQRRQQATPWVVEHSCSQFGEQSNKRLIAHQNDRKAQ